MIENPYLVGRMPAASRASNTITTLVPAASHPVLQLHPLGLQAEQLTEEALAVGTYRVLTPAAARLVGRLYIETESHLFALDSWRPRLVELGRCCVDPAFRDGGVIMMLWASLAAFMRDNGLEAAIGCASVPMHDGGDAAASLWQRLQAGHLAPPALQVLPRMPLALADLRTDLTVEPPPLVKGCLRCGATPMGAPAWDADLNVADLPMMLALADLPAVYRRWFLGD